MLKSKLIYIFCIVLFANSTIQAQDELIPNRVDNSWGFANDREKLKIAAIYDSVSPFSRGAKNKGLPSYAKVLKNGKWGLINTNGTLIVPHQFSILKEVGAFYYPNIYIVQNENKKFGMLQEDQLLTKIQYDTLYKKDFNIVVEKNDKLGLLSIEGKTYLPPIYDQITLILYSESSSKSTEQWTIQNGFLFYKYRDFSFECPVPDTLKRNDPFLVFKVSNEKETKYMVVPEIKSNIPPDFDEEFVETFESVSSSEDTDVKKELYASLEAKGYSFVKSYSKWKDVYIFKNTANQYGVYDIAKKIESIKPIYDDISEKSIYTTGDKNTRYFKVKKDNAYGLLSNKGTVVIDIKYDEITLDFNTFIFTEDNKSGFYSINTKKKSSCVYNYIDDVYYYKDRGVSRVLYKVERYGVIFYMDEFMREYYSKD